MNEITDFTNQDAMKALAIIVGMAIVFTVCCLWLNQSDTIYHEPINLDKPEETVKEDEHANNIGI